MMKRRVKVIALLLTVGVLLTALALWRSMPREPQLWDLAQEKTSAAGWSTHNDPGQPPHCFYFWLNTTDLLYFCNEDAVFQGYRLRLGGSRPNVERLPLQISQNDWPLELSPDSRFLLWMASVGSRLYIRPRISLVNGPLDRASPLSSPPFFSTDTPLQRRFRIDVTDAHVRYRIVRTPLSGEATYALYSEPYFPPHRFSEEKAPLPAGETPTIGKLPGSTSLSSMSADANVFPVHWVVHPQPGSEIYHTIRIGKHSKVQNVCVTPDGRRMFFEEISPLQDQPPKWPLGLFSRLRSQKEKHALVVVDMTTDRRKEVTTYQALPLPANRWDTEIHDAQWLPDGKQVSFIYRNKLFTLPVE